jgi:hypothetical protein
MYWYIVLIVAVITLYAWLYYIFPEDLIIYQTDLAHFDLSMLYNKQPIIIEDQVKEPIEIMNSWFNINFIEDTVATDIWTRNNYKYLMICSGETLSEITLCPPRSTPETSTELTTIKLKNNKILIVPFKYYFNIQGTVMMYGIDDYITYGLRGLNM